MTKYPPLSESTLSAMFKTTLPLASASMLHCRVAQPYQVHHILFIWIEVQESYCAAVRLIPELADLESRFAEYQTFEFDMSFHITSLKSRIAKNLYNFLSFDVGSFISTWEKASG